MRKHLRSIVSIALVSMGPYFTPAVAGNLVTNPDFDAGLSGWLANPSVPIYGTTSGFTLVSNAGSPSPPSAEYSASFGGPEFVSSNCMLVDASHNYDLYLRVAAQSPVGAIGVAAYSDANCANVINNLQPNDTFTQTPIDDNWVQLAEINFALPSGAHSAQVDFGPGPYMTTEFLFDHVLFGVTGTATTPPASIALGGYMSGNWFDPSPNQGGHGLQLEFTAQANTVVAIWFVYPPTGGGQNWIYAQGTFDSTKNSVTLPAILFTGPKFPPFYNSNDLQQTSWGTLTFTFADCDHGTASWASSIEGYGNGSIPIQRLTSIAGTSCPTAM